MGLPTATKPLRMPNRISRRRSKNCRKNTSLSWQKGTKRLPMSRRPAWAWPRACWLAFNFFEKHILVVGLSCKKKKKYSQQYTTYIFIHQYKGNYFMTSDADQFNTLLILAGPKIYRPISLLPKRS